MIEFKRVTKKYPNGLNALTDVSFHLPRGSFTFLTGHSGAGKSTLLKLISRSEIATRGQVLVREQNPAQLRGNAAAKYRRGIGAVFQQHQLLNDRSVTDNVALPLVVAGVAHREIQRRVRAALDLVGLLDKAPMQPLALSIGEQQRVGIARAVVARPPVLLADEPTGNLDPALADEIMRLFFQLNQVDVTLLVATHDYRHLRHADAQQHAGVLRLKNGRLVDAAGEVISAELDA